jgi:hypothetical protein
MVDDTKSHISYDKGNQFERQLTQEINHDLLNSHGVFSLDISPPKKLEITSSQRSQMREVIHCCNEKYLDWGFKDPRTCLVYPLWASELPEHKIIAIYRSPDEMWQRYRSKSVRRSYRVPGAAWKFIKRWCEYNAKILDYLQNTNRNFLVLSYQSLMKTQAEFERLQNFVGINLNDRRDLSLYRHRQQNDEFIKHIAWLIEKQAGYHPEKILKSLDALRENQIYQLNVQQKMQ